MRADKDIVPDPTSFPLHTSHDTESFNIRRLYSLTLELLITKIEIPFLSADDPMVVKLSERALSISITFDQISQVCYGLLPSSELA
jgi:hypothetical protein